jgi:hypothetical protein
MNRSPAIFNRFAERGGIDHLCAKLESYKFDEAGSVYDIEDKASIANTLKIISDYCYMAMLTDDVVYTLFTQKLNLLDLHEFDEIISKKMTKASEDLVKKSV